MKKTIWKLFWAWDFDKEENWLNEMSAKGLQLCSVGLCTYVFEEGLPSEYVYRLEFLNNLPNHADSIKYIRSIENTGAEHIGSLFRWVYFRKKGEGNEFILLSDNDSSIAHLYRIYLLLGILMVVNIVNAINLIRIWFSSELEEILIISIFSLIIGILFGYGFIQIYFKMRNFQQ